MFKVSSISLVVGMWVLSAMGGPGVLRTVQICNHLVFFTRGIIAVLYQEKAESATLSLDPLFVCFSFWFHSYSSPCPYTKKRRLHDNVPWFCVLHSCTSSKTFCIPSLPHCNYTQYHRATVWPYIQKTSPSQRHRLPNTAAVVYTKQFYCGPQQHSA